MNEKTRSEFWKCCYNFRMPTCGTVNLSDESKCYRCGYEWRESKMEPTPATNIEVLIAWLSADDDRRKEIEIASIPTVAGKYRRFYWDDGIDELEPNWIVEESDLPITNYEPSLWEPAE